MNLVIDIGNTLVKTGLFEGDKLFKKEVFSVLSIQWKKTIKSKFKVIISTNGNVKDLGIKKSNSIHFLTYMSEIPLEVDYLTPQTLGYDRIADAVGARYLCDNKNILIIDTGTAVTYDLVSENIYKGGNISPGLSLRYRTLNHFTASLPLGTIPEEHLLFGKSTMGAVNNGVYNGLLYEINGTIENFMKLYDDLKVFITGGDAQFFVNKIKMPIFAEPNLALIGLNQILKCN